MVYVFITLFLSDFSHIQQWEIAGKNAPSIEVVKEIALNNKQLN